MPAFVAVPLAIVVGFVLADFLADVVARTQRVTETRYTDWFADGLRVFLYFVAVVVGLGTMGVDIQVLNTFSEAAAWGLAAGLAIAIGRCLSGWVDATTSRPTSATGSPARRPAPSRPQ